MDFEAVKAWLTNQTNRQIRNRWLLALLGFVLLPFATAVGGALIYVFLYVITHQRDEHKPIFDPKCFWIMLGTVLVMFIVNLLISKKKEPETFYAEDQEVDDSLVGHYMHRRRVQAKFFLWIILTGPRLLSWSVFSLQEISRLKQQDTHSCAAVLWLLLTKGKKVSYPDIQSALDWLDLEATLPQILRISGVVQLQQPPPGLSLTEDLRNAIRTGESI